MTDVLHTLTTPMFNTMLGALLPMFAKAKAFAAGKKFDESVLVNGRLAPDMFALARQVQIAADFAKGCAARLSVTEAPKFDDSESSFDELTARVEKTLAFINAIAVEKYDGAQARTVKLTLGSQAFEGDGVTYVRNIVLPHFYFHIGMVYAILRHNGVALGKLDYLGMAPAV
jgi:uncharacterized protein